MKKTIILLFSVLSLNSFAEIGPMPFERTNLRAKGMPNATSGRYLYLGNVPKFETHELEITISKMSLTARVQGLVSQDKIDGYARQLFNRWKNVDQALKDPVFHLHPLMQLKELSSKPTKDIDAWVKIADQYTKHVLEPISLDIYRDRRNKKNFSDSRDEEHYKENISVAYFQSLFGQYINPEEILQDRQRLEEMLSPVNSRRLFQMHLDHLFTEDRSTPGYVGFVNFVFPIAATTEGPFSQPAEQIVTLKTAESMEARWWSDKWQDEFGGFPFLLIEYSGVAFHGPITHYRPLDVWFLRRGYVSHGCHRMDASDVLEFRALLPADLKKSGHKIRTIILDYFDVADLDKDGELEAIDVKYYNIPSSIAVGKGKSVDDVVRPYSVEVQASAFYKNHPYAAKFYDVRTDTLKNIPRYSIGKKSISKVGTHSRIPFRRFEYRGNRIIQYDEDGIRLQGFDDNSGKYPPRFFQQN